MEKIQERLQNPLIAGITGFVVGLVLGWFVIGWGIWPVEWENASPADLRSDAQVEYMRMLVDGYAADRDAATAQKRFAELGPNAEAMLGQIDDRPATLINDFKNAVGIGQAEVEEEAEGGNSLLLLFCLGVVVLLAVVGGIYFLCRPSGTREESVASQAARYSQAVERTDYESMGENPPLGQFMTTYMLGDDLFDDSFSIDAQGGDFLGECGVGIAETIGVGDPKKVSSYEVWLFDKNDIQTVTRVLMSEHAYHDPTSRERLAAKGEPVLAEPGATFVLDTATLQLVARIVDMEYGESALPENSFFSRLTLEMAVWNKPE